MSTLELADIQGPDNDHWGDYTKDHGDPYPATQEAYARVTDPLPEDSTARPADAMGAATGYAVAPWRMGTQTREVAAASWHPHSHVLPAGINAYELVEYDEQRISVEVVNYGDGDVYLSNSAQRTIGTGTRFLRGTGGVAGAIPDRCLLHTTARIYVFTLPGYAPGGGPVQLQVTAERYG